MKITRLLEIIEEDFSMAFRPDASGNRKVGANRRPDKRASNYPYDRDVSYGQPAAYDRSSHGNGPMRNPLTPHDTEHFSLSLLDLDEILGSPILMVKGTSSQMGSSVPGSGGRWSNNPPKDWDDDDMDEGGPLMIDPRPPDIEEVPNSHYPTFRDETDDDLENRLNRIYGREDNMDFVVDPPDTHVMGQDPFSAIVMRRSGRGTFGLIPKESAWDKAEKLASYNYRRGDDDEF